MCIFSIPLSKEVLGSKFKISICEHAAVMTGWTYDMSEDMRKVKEEVGYKDGSISKNIGIQ